MALGNSLRTMLPIVVFAATVQSYTCPVMLSIATDFAASTDNPQPHLLKTTMGSYDEGTKVPEFLRNAFCAGEKVRMMVEGGALAQESGFRIQ